MLLYTHCNNESNNTKYWDTPERSDTLTEEKETVEREGVKASLQWRSGQKNHVDFKRLSMLQHYFFFVKTKHWDLKAFTLINPDVTSVCFTDIVVGYWRGATQLVTDITTQLSQTGTESAPKSSHILFRYASKISERNRVWPVGKYFDLHTFFLLRSSIQIPINFVFEQAGKRKFQVFSFLLQPIEQWKRYVILKDFLQLVIIPVDRVCFINFLQIFWIC